MKKILSCVFCLLFFCGAGVANDGAFYVSGSALIPLQETNIRLKKEVLKFYVKDFDWMNVEVDFEFYNPGKAKRVVVGFVTPPADGDVQEEEHPRIKNFTVAVNGKALAYKMKRMEETTFSFEKLKIGGTDFVYYFPVTFKKGLNKIRHTYLFQGGSSVDTQRNFDYQITTGKRWANKQIDDFELQIYPDNGIFFIPNGFDENGKSADWKIVGDGVINSATDAFGEESPRVRLVHLNRGYLSLKEKNFKPERDIFFGEYNWAAGWITKACLRAEKCPDTETARQMLGYFRLRPYENIEDAYLEELSVEQLKIVRNYAFAVRGYHFTDKSLGDFYSQFFWYKPDKTLKLNDIKLTKEENLFIAKLKEIEDKKIVDEGVGILECDEYLKKYEACVFNSSSKVPEATRASLKLSFMQLRKQWREAAANPQSRMTLANGCKQALETAKQSLSTYCEW